MAGWLICWKVCSKRMLVLLLATGRKRELSDPGARLEVHLGVLRLRRRRSGEQQVQSKCL